MAVQALSALDLPPDEVLARLDDLVARLAVDEPCTLEECVDADPVPHGRGRSPRLQRVL
ncbi:hypothetical protein [Streptomyces sp. NPDC001978]|uniref:hypothetical protein n=1 Tax=Streptomyces sp. NPDC001978 TaxID=3364627 RepID=UPI0036C9AF7D